MVLVTHSVAVLLALIVVSRADVTTVTTQHAAAPSVTIHPTAAPSVTNHPTAAPSVTNQQTAAPSVTNHPTAAPSVTNHPTAAPSVTTHPTTAAPKASVVTTHHTAAPPTTAHGTGQVHTTAHTAAPATQSSMQNIEHLLNSLQKEMTDFKAFMKQTMSGLARQMILQQFFVEERIRSEGGSGIKQVRNYMAGSKPYHSHTHSSSLAASVHEHANYDRTVGLGEFNAVLNGVDFRTRHNDYRLSMPHRTRKDYDMTEEIPFPDVPPSVLSKHTMAEQIAEMREYFKAFHYQDWHIRDYRPYFKPVMCYLEGAWTTDTRSLIEPFHSDRHFIDATSWFDLQEKIRFMSSSGAKNLNENYSYLPTTIINVTENGEPIYAQWNYRIVCHPITSALNLQDFEPIDDLAVRMLNNYNMSEYSNSKATRFSLAPYGGGHYQKESQSGTYESRRYLHGLMDKIMYEIPGKDNYMGYIEDKAFGLLKLQVDKTNETLNVARYSRHYKYNQPSAMGTTVANRGFSDPSMYVAETSNPRIAKISVTTDCNKVNGTNVCNTYEGRHTYAIPLEVIWLTPLQKWNPYNLTYQNNAAAPGLNRRTGGFSKQTAYNGTSKQFYYITPVDFFIGGATGRDPADTAKDSVGVLDEHGNVCNVTASGIRIFTPNIPGVGKVRIRYPVFPLHHDGNIVFKNLLALQDISMDMKKWSRMFEQKPEVANLDAHPADTHYVLAETHMNPPGTHHHDFYLTAEEMKAIARNGTVVSVYTTENNGHQHALELIMDPAHANFQRLIVKSCDGKPTCWDSHPTLAWKDN
ncbi:uncharacterized protein LOC127881513 [Dreissena polymorpha]|uniref:Uncharacterized protein n=1 Tax=Dreissena polymorpha TaxID=45954 RepID=A0A9D4H6B1_DREPO|nr:uncharacterized protein LOC127881513 [Dreissena polymorpha]KAH3827759.1 hypothetical protein DPMN_129701 [Dreissena polymorpha]